MPNRPGGLGLAIPGEPELQRAVDLMTKNQNKAKTPTKRITRKQPKVVLMVVFIGCPHSGHLSAAKEISLPHEGHLTNIYTSNQLKVSPNQANDALLGSAACLTKKRRGITS
jgi:hypothetical protein